MSYKRSKLFDKKILTASEVAQELGVSIGHIYNLTSKKRIPFIKKGKRLYFIADEIENWLLEGNYNERKNCTQALRNN